VKVEDQKAAGHHGGVGQVENPGAKRAEAEVQEVPDVASAEPAIEQVADSAGADQRQGKNLKRIHAGDEHVSKHRGDSGGASDREESGAPLKRKRFAEAEEASAIFGVIQADRIGEKRFRFVAAKIFSGDRFGLLVAADRGDQREQDQSESFSDGHATGLSPGKRQYTQLSKSCTERRHEWQAHTSLVFIRYLCGNCAHPNTSFRARATSAPRRAATVQYVEAYDYSTR